MPLTSSTRAQANVPKTWNGAPPSFSYKYPAIVPDPIVVNKPDTAAPMMDATDEIDEKKPNKEWDYDATVKHWNDHSESFLMYLESEEGMAHLESLSSDPLANVAEQSSTSESSDEASPSTTLHDEDSSCCTPVNEVNPRAHILLKKDSIDPNCDDSDEALPDLDDSELGLSGFPDTTSDSAVATRQPASSVGFPIDWECLTLMDHFLATTYGTGEF